MRIKQSACYPMMKPEGMGLEEFFRTARAIGYAAVELWGRGDDFDDVVKLARKHKLAIAVMSGHKSLTDGLNVRANHDRIEGELKESIDLAARHAIPGLICLAGSRQPGLGDDEAVDIVAEGLRRVAAYAEKKRVNLNLELLNSKIDHPGYQGDHTAWGVAVCRRAASRRVKLLYDVYHMQIMEGDIIRTITDNIDFIGHFHTAGVPGRHEFDDAQELNYRGICRAIAATSYSLYVGHEFEAKGSLVEAMRLAFETCDVE